MARARSTIITTTTFLVETSHSSNFLGSSWHGIPIPYYDDSIVLGPCGGHGGDEWNDGVHNGVTEITLIYGSCNDSIRVTYDNNGKPYLAEKHGGFSGMKSSQIKLQYLEEILVRVSGHYCRVVYVGSPVIRSLTFKTNKRSFGPFGVEEGTPFNISTNGDRIVGFYGRSRWFMDSLGFYLSSPKPNLVQRFNITSKGFNQLAIRDDKHNKNKGSKGYRGYSYVYEQSPNTWISL